MSCLTLKMKRLCGFFLTLFLLSGLAGCDAVKLKRERSLSISVPCSIFAAFCEILDAYKLDHPGVKVSFDTGNTIVLMRKIL